MPSPPPQRITVLGDGQMGLVCCAVLAEQPRPGAGRPSVTLWGHNRADLTLLAQKRSSPRLPVFTLPPPEVVHVEPDLAEAVTDATMIISAVPAQHTRSVWERLRGMADALGARCGVVSVAKGIENGTLLRPTEVILDALGERGTGAPGGRRPIAALSGPTIATELARCLPATMVAAVSPGEGPEHGALAQSVQRAFTTSWLRVYTSDDLVGVELAGALKNVIAIAAGALDGLHAGYNAKSALLARGLAEIVRLGVAMGAKQETFFGIAGVGDLATSCFSPEGRNRSLGEALGRGERLEDALGKTASVIEGVATARSVMELARRHGVEMPIAQAVHAVLFEGVDPIEAITGLMRREVKAERVG